MSSSDLGSSDVDSFVADSSDMDSSDMDSSDTDSPVCPTRIGDVWSLGILVRKSPESSSSLPKEPSMSIAPTLKKFSFFSTLPTEIRAMIWELSLEPRFVELEFTHERGFYTSAKPPAALQVCQDSREAVAKLYPICFGRVIYKPRVFFNFSLDTLYLSKRMKAQIHHFLGILSRSELSKLESIAIDYNINTNHDYNALSSIDHMESFLETAKFMSSLRVLQVVYEVADWLEAPEGSGPIRLHRRLPSKFKRHWRRMTSEMEGVAPNTKDKDIIPPTIFDDDFEMSASCKTFWGCR